MGRYTHGWGCVSLYTIKGDIHEKTDMVGNRYYWSRYFLISQMEMVRYKYVPMPTGGGVYKVDRFTGDTYLVTPSGIRKVRER